MLLTRLSMAALLALSGPMAARAPAAGAGGWRSPLDGPLAVERGFDPPEQDWLPGHRGVDLRSVLGATVRAAGAGTVTFAGILAGRGVVTVTHGELRTTYEPLDVLVVRGQDVDPGTPLGRLDPGHGDPAPGEAQLHWGLRRGEAYLDPLRLLGHGPVRLLPRWAGETVSSADPPPRPTAYLPLASAPRRELAGATSERPTREGRPRAGAGVVAAMAAVAAVGALGAARRRE